MTRLVTSIVSVAAVMDIIQALRAAPSSAIPTAELTARLARIGMPLSPSLAALSAANVVSCADDEVRLSPAFQKPLRPPVEPLRTLRALRKRRLASVARAIRAAGEAGIAAVTLQACVHADCHPCSLLDIADDIDALAAAGGVRWVGEDAAVWTGAVSSPALLARVGKAIDAEMTAYPTGKELAARAEAVAAMLMAPDFRLRSDRRNHREGEHNAAA